MQNNDFLTEKYTIDTPENVTFGYEVVGIGSRFVAALVDTILLTIVLILLSIVTFILVAQFSDLGFGIDAIINSSNDEWIVGIIFAVYTLLNFIIFWGYYIFFELLWNGQSPGKRAAKIRVVRTDGNPIGFLQSAVRNLVRFVDFMPTLYGFGIVTMFCNSKARRLGDFAAGTIVIRDKTELNLADIVAGSGENKPTATDTSISTSPATTQGDLLSASMAAPASAVDPLLNRFPNMRLLTTSDYELITDTLARRQSGQLDNTVVNRLATAIAKKLDEKLPTATYGSRAYVDFLQDVAEAYRRMK